MGARAGRFERDRGEITRLKLEDIEEVLWAIRLRTRETSQGAIQQAHAAASAHQSAQSRWEYARRRAGEAFGSSVDRVKRNLGRWSMDQMFDLFDAGYRAMVSRGLAAQARIDRKYPQMLEPGNQHRMQRGDILTNNYGGPRQLGDFRHCVLVVDEPQMIEELGRSYWTYTAVQAGGGRVTMSKQRYPVDLLRLYHGTHGEPLTAEAALALIPLSAGEHATWIVRFRRPSAAVLDEVCRIGRLWAGAEGRPPLRYEWSFKVAHPGVCLGSGHNRVDPRAAERYMHAIDAKPGAELGGVICSELVFAAWTAALGFQALQDGRPIESVLEHDLPIVDARGCWPRSGWALASKVARSWEHVGVVMNVQPE
jgi:hypothetical protein